MLKIFWVCLIKLKDIGTQYWLLQSKHSKTHIGGTHAQSSGHQPWGLPSHLDHLLFKFYVR